MRNLAACQICGFCCPACRVVCPGMGLCTCPRVACAWVGDSPRVSGMPRRVQPGAGGRLRLCPGIRKGRGHVWCPLPFEVWVRRRATLPHPSGCSTIAVPGLSFRVRNGSGRLPWAMAAANLVLYIPRDRVSTCSLGGSWWVGDRIVDATEGLIHVTGRVSPRRPLSMFAPAALYGRVCVLPFDC